MNVLLINPDNPVVTLTKRGRWLDLNKFRVWKPLSLFTLAAQTPSSCQVEIVDENLGRPNYDDFTPDLVGLTAFTSQATRAYELAAYWRARGVRTVMGGIHASMCTDEALGHVDAVVKGEGEVVWPELLWDAERLGIKRVYDGGLVPVERISPARHDLLASRYYTGAIQTTRGCPLRCTFCSVTAFNGGAFRHRLVDHVIEELAQIREKVILFVDDNLVGVHQIHMDYAKDLFRAMIANGLTTPWFCQSTVNFADDDELLRLARQAGCFGVYIGFEAIDEEGLKFVHKRFNTRGNRSIPNSVARIRDHGITVTGSFIMGIDTDTPGVGARIAKTAKAYGVDVASVLIATPLPGTVMYDEIEKEGRIIAKDYPRDWQRYTLAHHVMAFKQLTWEQVVEEMDAFRRRFYSPFAILCRTLRAGWRAWYRVMMVNVNYLYNFLLWFRTLRHGTVS